MAETTNISKLIINYLTEQQYATTQASGLINANELYIESAQRLLGVAHPTNHPPSIITQDASNRFVTDAEKTAWNAKAAGIHKSTHATGGTDVLTPSDIGAATSTHTHGNITNGGAVGSTPNLPIFTGASGSLETKSIKDAQTLLGAASRISGTATLATANWTGTAAPYSYVLTVTGILATDTPHIDRVTGTDATAAALINTAWGLITGNPVKPQTSAGTITFYATAKPSVAVPIMYEVVRS